jgi:hypothetical protein
MLVGIRAPGGRRAYNEIAPESVESMRFTKRQKKASAQVTRPIIGAKRKLTWDNLDPSRKLRTGFTDLVRRPYEEHLLNQNPANPLRLAGSWETELSFASAVLGSFKALIDKF